MTQRERELNKDIKRVGEYLGLTSDPDAVEGLQRLIMILMAWKAADES